MSNIYDIGIIGMGVAGTFAAYKLAKSDLKVIGFDIGRPPLKRRRQIEGFLGCLPNSDGKLYLNDLDRVASITGSKKTKASYNSVIKIIKNLDEMDFKIINDKSPNASMLKKIKKAEYDLSLNDYIQLYPKDIHLLSKSMAETIEQSKNMSFSFDNEVKNIYKQKNIFIITTEEQEYKCKKIIIAVGRSGWRWAKTLFSNFGIIDNNDLATFGIRIETTSNIMKDFNKSNCTIVKNNEWELGPLSWFGTVIPEDHLDVAISAFRSNENRWKTDKVSFSLIGNRVFPGKGSEQTDRISKLTFILANDRIIKERVSHILNDKSTISIIPEYSWLKEAINELSLLVPEIATKGYYHVPTILPMVPKVNLGDNLESEIDGMFIVGESASVHGILAAATMGILSAGEIMKLG